MSVEASESITIKGEGLTLSRLIWRRFKRKPEGYLERVLEANPGIAAAGPYLPVGAVVTFPLDGVYDDGASGATVISIWD